MGLSLHFKKIFFPDLQNLRGASWSISKALHQQAKLPLLSDSSWLLLIDRRDLPLQPPVVEPEPPDPTEEKVMELHEAVEEALRSMLGEEEFRRRRTEEKRRRREEEEKGRYIDLGDGSYIV